jgi:glycosyltransferase involved in cell wall biosynthesis
LVVVAPSKWIADKARKSLVFKHQRIEIVPNSAIIESAQMVDKRQAREKLGISGNSFVVGCVAADLLDPQKNIGALVNEVEIFKDNHANVDLVILAVGGGMLRSDAVTVFQTGLLHDLNEIALAYVAMDAFVSLSLTENFPLTVVEAAFAGVPAIALDAGGISEIVKNGETGLVISDPSEFQNALEIVVSNRKLREYMSTNSKAFAAEEFSLGSVLNRYRAIYESF